MIYKGIPEEERIERARQALKIVGLQNKENNLPSQMSGGQQQRVAIARAIVNDAPLILADEPTGNLDTKTSIDVMEFFVNLNESLGKTIVLVTHEPDIAEYTKRTLRFKDGKIIEDIRRR
jgi:putative ABC transport system ATP-binding protein